MLHDHEDAGMISPQLQSQLIQRVSSLESQLQQISEYISFSRSPDGSEKVDDLSDRIFLSTEIRWMKWQEYLQDTSEATNVLEVLYEKPHTNNRRKFSANTPQKLSKKPPVSPYKNIERIRIRSHHIISALQVITEQTFFDSSSLIIHRPFKVLLYYYEQIQDYLREIEHDLTKNTQCGLGKHCKILQDSFADLTGPQVSMRAPNSSIRSTFQEKTLHNPSENAVHHLVEEQRCRHEVAEDMIVQFEAITHLRTLVDFMTEEMGEIFSKHEFLRSSRAEKVAFEDVWHLFMAGDLVVAETESSGGGSGLYQVATLPSSDIYSSSRPVNQIKTKVEGHEQLIRSVYREDAIIAESVFTVDAFYFDFDGQNFGPVERRIKIKNFEGEKSIVDLPLYPLRFRRDAISFKAMLLQRGMKFRELSPTAGYPHREYNDMSVDEPQEQVRFPCASIHYISHLNWLITTTRQIDSQVIIDFALAYRKFPGEAPRFGLKPWIADDARVVVCADPKSIGLVLCRAMLT